MPQISFYKNIKETESRETLHLDLFLESIRNGKWQDEIIKLRTITDNDLRKLAKLKLPNVTISGIFGKRLDNDLKVHSGILAMDLDDLGEEKEGIKNLLRQDPYIYAMFTSCGGKGLCLLFKIDAERHRDAFYSIADYLIKKYQIVCDPSGVNESRTRFVSFDPDLHINENALVFRKYLPKPKPRNITATIFVQDEFTRVVNEMVAAKVSCVEDYRDWRDIAFGLADQFGEAGRGYFHSLSSCSAKYEPSMCDRQYTAALRRNGTRGGNKITIATIYWYAKRAGINVNSDRTKKIAAATSTMKQGGLSADAIAENLKKLEGIEDAGDIIQQAFAANENFAESESLVENIRMWLRHNFHLKRNLITRKIEDNGVPLEEVDFNTMFLDAKVLFDRLDWQLFTRVLFSRNTPSYNPLKDYFDALEWDGVPRLNKVGETINSDTGDVAWRCKMVRKWIVGIVSSVYGEVNELNLLLVGGKNTGKTQFFKRLLPVDLKPYFAMSQLNRGTDDEILMCEKLLILNDEYGGKNKMDERNEKRLMAADRFDLRVPYGKGNETVLRIASLGGTCNELGVLDDPTGNRRIIVMRAAGKFNFDVYNSIDKTQLFAEVVAAFKAGERPTLTDEDIAQLERLTDGAYSKVSVEGELIQKHFLTPQMSSQFDFMTTTDVKVELEKHTRTNLNINHIGSQLLKFGYVRKKKSGVYGYEIGKKGEGSYGQLPAENLPF